MLPTQVVKVLRSSDGTAIFAEATGRRENPAVVLIHGLALSGAVFDNLFADKRLTDKLYLVRYDLRGHGRSGKPATADGYASCLFADDFAAIVKEFGLDKPILVGWSYGATVLADACAHLDPLPVSGTVFLAALPYVGPIMGRVGTPTVLGFLPGLTSLDDPVLTDRTRFDFVESVFADPGKVPFSDKIFWLGQSTLQSGPVLSHILSRPQDPTKLHEAGQRGLPMLILGGTADRQVKSDVVVDEMKPHFKNLEVRLIDGGSHALFYDFQDEFVDSLINFVARVKQAKAQFDVLTASLEALCIKACDSFGRLCKVLTAGSSKTCLSVATNRSPGWISASCSATFTDADMSSAPQYWRDVKKPATGFVIAESRDGLRMSQSDHRQLPVHSVLPPAVMRLYIVHTIQQILPTDTESLTMTIQDATTTHHFDAILFDMDGTLIDSTAGVVDAWTLFAEKYPWLNVQEILASAHGVRTVENLRNHCHIEDPEELEREAVRFEEAIIHAANKDGRSGIVALPGARENTEALAAGAKLPHPVWALCTSATRAYASQSITAAGLILPDIFVTAEDVKRGKPAPDPYLLGAKLLGIEPAKCLVIEDAPTGIRSGTAAGCKTMGLITSHTREQVEAEHPTYLVKNLSQVTMSLCHNGGVDVTIHADMHPLRN
ncbi:hypothetical protein NM688_g3129 [Phlebia brevispora]|uniref:Uncharacterized protein n=1 Tax=Phlebia brevispora TaxID=194682 RepID=A0ACC1T6K1_9APHY|nr:hypothetical protein NM688_g3129 [Phlebia brevispora]